MRFSVMTFNVRGSFHEDGANDWDKRRSLNIATIKKYAPDIVGFQEAQQGNIEDYAANLTEYAVELGLISIRQTERYHQLPLYWNATRFEKVQSGGFYLSETPGEWSIGWESTLVRAATWVKLHEITTGMEFVVLNTHFPHEPEAESTRTKCVVLIIEQLAKIAPDIPHIVMADFNTQPTSEAYQTFIKSDYIDTYTAAGEQAQVNTFHGFAGDDYDWKSGRIDWILTKDATQAFQAVSCFVIKDAEPPLYPSDHYPVLTELDFA
jgi:endonuclease/exonuclease/phosphatase family metal-dependent hydrolase